MKEKESIIEKEWIAHGFECKVIFVRQTHRCGYVGVPREHPAYGKPYESLPVEVHGGLTYGEDQLLDCEDDLYWFGFDCAHAGDKTLSFISCSACDHFWTLEEVITETEQMARQFVTMTLGQIIAEHLRWEPDWVLNNITIEMDVAK